MLDLPTDKPEVVEKGADRARRLRRRPDADRRQKSTRSAASSSRSGAAASAPDRASATSSSRSCSTTRATPSGCRSASRRSSATRRSRGCAPSTTPGTAPSGWRSIAVGDIDPQQIEQTIKTPFSPLTDARARAPRARSEGAAPPAAAGQRRRRPRGDAVERADRAQAAARRRADASPTTAAISSRGTIDHMMDERFGELERKPDAKFLGAGVGDGGLSRDVSTFSMARAGPGRQARGRPRRARRRSAARPRVRVQRRPSSIAPRQWMAAFYERAYTERDKTESGSFAQEYVSYFLERRAEPRHRVRVPARQAAAADASPTPTRRRWRGRCSATTAASSSRRRRRSPASRSRPKAELQAALDRGDRDARHAVDRHQRDARADGAGADGRRRRVAPHDSTTLGVTVVRFANGVEAWLKPTDFKNDQVVFTMDGAGRHLARAAGRLPRGVARHRAASAPRAPAA